MAHTIVNDAPAPGTPEWRRIITASKVPVILGVSRFQSQFALWHEMAGNVAPRTLDETPLVTPGMRCKPWKTPARP